MKSTTLAAAAAFALGATGLCLEALSQRPVERSGGAIALSYAPSDPAASDAALSLELARRFQARAAAMLEDAVETARDRVARSGDADPGPSPGVFLDRREQSLAVSAKGGRLISVEITDFVDHGGAHPNTELSAVIWDARAGRPIDWTALFGDTAPPAEIAQFWRAEILATKRARFGPRGEAEFAARLKTDPVDLRAVPVAFSPSAAAGQAGGLVFLHEPYALGAYAEGVYRITVPASAFAEALDPAYAPFFGGEAAAEQR